MGCQDYFKGPLDGWQTEQYLEIMHSDNLLRERKTKADEILNLFIEETGVSHKVFGLINTIFYLEKYPERLSCSPDSGEAYGELMLMRFCLTDHEAPLNIFGLPFADTRGSISVYPLEILYGPTLNASNEEPNFFRYPVYLAVDSKLHPEPKDYIAGRTEHIDAVLPGLIEVCGFQPPVSLEDKTCSIIGHLAKNFPKGAEFYPLGSEEIVRGAKYNVVSKLVKDGYTPQILSALEELSMEYIELDRIVRERMQSLIATECYA
jgi:hypothetical protein